MPRTSTYAYSPGSGAAFHIEVSGRPFGVASDSEEEEEAEATEAHGARGAWLSLLRAAVDAAFDEVEVRSPAKMLLKKTAPEMSAGSPIAALDWQSPSDVSTEAPWNQDSPSTRTSTYAYSPGSGAAFHIEVSGRPFGVASDSEEPAPRRTAEGGGTEAEAAAAEPRRQAAGGGPDLVQGSAAEDLQHTSDGATRRRFEVCAAPPYQGVQYRRSKCLGDLHPSRFAENGTHVLGYLEGEGAWLRLPPRGNDDAEGFYLPVTMEGERLLRPTLGPGPDRARSDASSPFSWTCCVREMDESDADPCFVRGNVAELAAEAVD